MNGIVTTFTPQKAYNFFCNPDASLEDATEYEGSAVGTALLFYGAAKGVKGIKGRMAEVSGSRTGAIVEGAPEVAIEGVSEVKNSISQSTRGWKVGDPINNLTKSGKYPSWNTAKQRYWKNTANAAEEGEYSLSDLNRMAKGKAPTHPEINVPKELHHIEGRTIADPHNIGNLQEMWPWEHADIDPFRYYNGMRP